MAPREHCYECRFEPGPGYRPHVVLCPLHRAAPALLGALKEALPRIDSGNFLSTTPLIVKVRAAIRATQGVR